MSVGLAIFGVTMYELYSSSQYRQLSADLKSAVPLVTQELAQKAGVDLPKPNPGYGPSSSYDPSSRYRPEGGAYGQGSHAPGRPLLPFPALPVPPIPLPPLKKRQ